jgi:hypothetical protein
LAVEVPAGLGGVAAVAAVEVALGRVDEVVAEPVADPQAVLAAVG